MKSNSLVKKLIKKQNIGIFIILVILGIVAIYIKLNRVYLNTYDLNKLVHTDGYYELQDMFMYEGDYVYALSYEKNCADAADNADAAGNADDADDAGNADGADNADNAEVTASKILNERVTVRMASDNTMDADGSVGIVLFEDEVDADDNGVRIKIHVPKNLYHVYLRVSDNVTITELVERNEKTYNDPIIFYIMAVIITILFIIGRDRLPREKFETVMFICVLTVLSMIPFMNDFLPDSHDIKFHLTRISGIAHAIKNGQFPVKINTIQAWGYGYASSTMYPQLFLAVPVFFRLIGMSLLNSYKMLMLSIQLMTAIVSYLSFKGMFKDTTIAKIGCALYMFSMYRLDNLYVRGDVGESLAFVFLPLVVWGAYEIFFRDYSKWILLTLGMTGEIGCHIISTEIYTIALAVTFVIALFIMSDRPKRIMAVVKAAVVALLLNAGFIIPFIQYYLEGFVSTGTMGLYLPDQTEYLSQMFVTFSHYLGKGNIPKGTTQNEMSLTIGFLPLIGLALYYLIRKIYKEQIESNEDCKESIKIAKGSIIAFVVFLISSLWLIPWDIMPHNAIIDTISYPIYFFWRLIGIVQFFACCYICAAIDIWFKVLPSKKILISSLTIIVAIAFGWPAIDAMTQFPTYPNAESIANMNATDYNYFYMDVSFDGLMNRGEIVEVSDDSLEVVSYNKNELRVDTTVNVSSGSQDGRYVELPLYYYPGYQVHLDDEKVEALRGNNGMLRVNIPNDISGTVKVVGEYKQSVLWRVAECISLLTVVLLGIYGIRKKKNEKSRGYYIK